MQNEFDHENSEKPEAWKEEAEEKKERWNRIQKIGDHCMLELLDSIDEHGDMQSCHEGYAVLLEEVDELWEEIKTNPMNVYDVEQEAKQVSAMAMKLMLYIWENEYGGDDEATG